MTDARTLRQIANMSADALTTLHIVTALGALHRHKDVESVTWHLDSGFGPTRSFFKIKASFQTGILDGEYSVGRCLHAMLGPNENLDAKAAMAAAAMAAAAHVAREQQARQDNLERFTQAGFRPETLAWYVNSLARGSYIAPDDRAHDAFDFYVREIVRGGDFPLDLSRYLAGFTC